MEILLTYTQVKAIVLSKTLLWQYTEFTEKYIIFSLDGPLHYICEVFKSGFEPIGLDVTQNTSDRNDFEGNYKTGANKRLKDDVPVVAEVVRQFARQDVTTFPTTLITYNVPSDKNLYIETWHVDTEGALALVELKVAGRAKDAIRLSNTANTNRQNNIFGVHAALLAQAGQAVTVVVTEGSKGKEFTVGFSGVLRSF